MISPQAVKYVGLPYRLGGRDWDGVDCAGLVLLYLRHEQGVMLPETDGEPITSGCEEDSEERFLRYLERFCVPVRRPQNGDMMLVHILRRAAHLGVMVSESDLLHITQDRTSEIVRSSCFGHRIIGFWRVVRSWETMPIR